LHEDGSRLSICKAQVDIDHSYWAEERFGNILSR